MAWWQAEVGRGMAVWRSGQRVWVFTFDAPGGGSRFQPGGLSSSGQGRHCTVVGGANNSALWGNAGWGGHADAEAKRGAQRRALLSTCARRRALVWVGRAWQQAVRLRGTEAAQACSMSTTSVHLSAGQMTRGQ